MIPSRAAGIDNDKDRISTELVNWVTGKEKILNLVSVPYNSSIILLDMIIHQVQDKKRILYITGENEEKINLIDNLKKFTTFRDYMYIRKNSGKSKSKASLYITQYDMAITLEKNFDLVVYDDINSFPEFSKFEILELLASFYKEGAKVMSWSVEAVFQNAKTIEIPVKDIKIPLAEPRIITTRIDLNKDIPYVVYDYLTWSIKSERKVIIYVPDSTRAENVYKYLWNFRETLHNNIMYYKDKEDMKRLLNFIKNKKGIIIMDYYGEIDVELKDIDILVYFADDKIFDYKKLIYFSGKVGRNPGLGNGEVIFLAKESTKDMEIARDMARGFNKMAWDMGFLNL